jgi:hypothetical protein
MVTALLLVGAGVVDGFVVLSLQLVNTINVPVTARRDKVRMGAIAAFLSIFISGGGVYSPFLLIIGNNLFIFVFSL